MKGHRRCSLLSTSTSTFWKRPTQAYPLHLRIVELSAVSFDCHSTESRRSISSISCKCAGLATPSRTRTSLTCRPVPKPCLEMSTPALDPRKRPPPIAIPQWPPSQTVAKQDASTNAAQQTKASNQHQQRFASSSSQAVVRSGTTTPLTSPLELDETCIPVPKTGSQASRHRSSAMTTLSGLVDQARSSPRKSDGASMPSRHGSTARSRQSERSHRSAAAAQAKLEALGEDEMTTRSQIESRSEKKLFKMTGQVPPTPSTGLSYPAITQRVQD